MSRTTKRNGDIVIVDPFYLYLLRHGIRKAESERGGRRRAENKETNRETEKEAVGTEPSIAIPVPIMWAPLLWRRLPLVHLKRLLIARPITPTSSMEQEESEVYHWGLRQRPRWTRRRRGLGLLHTMEGLEENRPWGYRSHRPVLGVFAAPLVMPHSSLRDVVSNIGKMMKTRMRVVEDYLYSLGDTERETGGAEERFTRRTRAYSIVEGRPLEFYEIGPM